LVDSPLLPRLEVLDLSRNYLGAESGTYLATSPHLGRLRLLDLRNNRLGGEVVDALLSSPQRALNARAHRRQRVEHEVSGDAQASDAGRLVLD
jgi:hypothetical protein